MILVIEGGDGVGKDTVAAAVAKVLDAEIVPFPNDAAFTGPLIRSYLRKEWSIAHRADVALPHQTPGALAFQALQIANRMELMPRLREAQRRGRDLVLVRYWQSAWVYGQLDGLPPDWLDLVHRSMVQPDVSILLDAPAEVCMERRAARDGALAPERYEGRIDFTKRVVELYRDLWNDAAARDGAWLTVDATQPFHDVVADVIEASR